VTSPPEPSFIYDWAVPGNLQPEPMNPEEEISTVDVPVRIQVDWARLAHLVRG
jgi:hypothetical protein